MQLQPNQPSKCSGVTLVEFVIAIAIIGILLSVAIPEFRELVKNRRFAALASDVAGAINLARSEAIKRGSPVFISALDGSDSTDEWGAGFRVWFDDDENDAYTPGGSEDIHLFPAVADSLTIDQDDDFTTIRFDTHGHLSVTGSTTTKLSICDDDVSGETGRIVFTSLSGQIRIAEGVCS